MCFESFFFWISRGFPSFFWISGIPCVSVGCWLAEKALRHPSKAQTRRQPKETLQIRKQCCRKPARNPTDSRVPKNSGRVPQFLHVPALLRARHARNPEKPWRPARLMGTARNPGASYLWETHCLAPEGAGQTQGNPASVPQTRKNAREPTIRSIWVTRVVLGFPIVLHADFCFSVKPARVLFRFQRCPLHPSSASNTSLRSKETGQKHPQSVVSFSSFFWQISMGCRWSSFVREGTQEP